MKENSDSVNLEALKFINDWSKWLITIETGAIAITGTLFSQGTVGKATILMKFLGISAIVSFVLSIISAAFLLWTLPEIAQNLRPGENIWLTEDSVAGELLRMNTQRLAVIESIFFIIGILLFTIVISSAILTS